MQLKYRFIGIRPFETDEKDIFFEREDIAEKIYNSLYLNSLTVVHSQAGYGKTSIIKAGVIPKLQQKSELIFFYVSIPNFIKNSRCKLSEIIFENINSKLPKNSYLDKIIEPENSLWYKLKRIEATDNVQIILILDQFENIFSFSETEIAKFKDELVKALFEQIPQNLRSKIEEKLTENKNLLTPKGYEKLYKNISLKLLISTRTDKLHKLEFFADKIHNITDKLIEIEPITAQQAKNIFIKTATYTPKYKIDDKFLSQPFEITDELLSEIVDFLTQKGKNSVETYQLQIIGLEIEKISTKLMINRIGRSQVSDFAGLYNDYYQAVINKIENNIQRVSARKFIEDELIFEYEHRKLTVYQGVARKKYKLTDETINLLIQNNIIAEISNKDNEIFYEISHDALITPILIAKDKRIKYEIEIENELRQKKFLELQAERQKQRIARIRRTVFVFALLLIVAVSLGVTAYLQKQKAVENERIATSNMYAAYALNALPDDPTKSYRLAQKAYFTAPENPLAYESLIKAFYETNIFYGQVVNSGMVFDDAVISHNCKNILLIKNSDRQNLLLAMMNSKGEITPFVANKTYVSSANFSADDSCVIVSYYAGYAVLYDLRGNEIQRFEHGGIVNFATISDDKKFVATCGDDQTTKIWTINGKLKTVLRGFSGKVKYADFSNDNRKIVAADNNYNIIVYEIGGKILRKYTYPREYEFQNNEIQPVMFSPDDSKILFVVNDYLHFNFQIDVWDYKNDKILSKFQFFDSWINTAYFVDNQTIIATTKDGKAYWIDIKNHSKKLLSGHTGSVCDARYNPENELIYTISTDKTLRTWKIYNLNTVFDKFSGKTFVNISNSSKYVAFQDDSLRIFDLAGNEIYKTSETCSMLAFSPDDKYILLLVDENKFKQIDFHAGSERILSDSVRILSVFCSNDKIIAADNSAIYFLDYSGKLIDNQSINKNFDKIYLSENSYILQNQNAIFLYDYGQDLQKKAEFSGIEKVDFGKDAYIVQCQRKIYFLYENMDIAFEIASDVDITASDLSKNANFIAFGNSNGKFTIFDKYHKKILDYDFPQRITKIKFSPDEKFVLVQYLSPNFSIETKMFLLDPDEIIKYTDNLKLYGNISITIL